MDWLESIQKLAPWAGSLPILHKLALSVIIVGLATFSLLLVWVPAPSSMPTTQDANSSLNIIVNSSGAAAEAARKFVNQLDEKASLDRIEDKIEKSKLKKVIRELVSIEHSQAPLPWLLRNYVQSEDPRNWGQVKAIISENTPIITELVDVLKKFDGDLIYKDLDTYKQLHSMMMSRAGLYAGLSKMGPPKSPDEKAKLLKIADNFDMLISQIKLVQLKLSYYLKTN